MKSNQVKINKVFEANNGSFAKVLTIISNNRAIVQTYHPKASNDFSYTKVISFASLISGNFRSVDSPNKYGGYIDDGVYNTSCKRLSSAWNNTQKYANRTGRKLKHWLSFKKFSEWYVSYPSHMEKDWILNYDLMGSVGSIIDENSTCLLSRDIVNALRVNKVNCIVKKTGSGFVINDFINLGLSQRVIFLREQDAIDMYCKLKEDKVKLLAERYSEQLPDHVYQALKLWKCRIDVS